ncbi:MAG: hypothetical protein AYL29_012350 [Candidatus Bathyarchaeota archaeon B24]|nr:MAG: hypothetical protein AYL29_012350 [Candidatus Bathyarchaeota archaeon B24]
MINFVRNELDVEHAIVHPQLCVDDGDRFWNDYLREGDKRVSIVGGCDSKMQRKFFKEIFTITANFLVVIFLSSIFSQ